jgi:hypothetical protein
LAEARQISKQLTQHMGKNNAPLIPVKKAAPIGTAFEILSFKNVYPQFADYLK